MDLSKSLTELEADDWGSPADTSNLVSACLALRHKPVRELSDNELRLAINQQFSLVILVPVALSRLESAPLLQGNLFPGDLLTAVLRVPRDFWHANPPLWRVTFWIASRAMARIEDPGSWVRTEFDRFLVSWPQL